MLRNMSGNYYHDYGGNNDDCCWCHDDYDEGHDRCDYEKTPLVQTKISLAQREWKKVCFPQIVS